MDFWLTILPFFAWAVCIALFTIPQVWGAVFTLSLLGHLSQFIKKDEPA
ncbi:MAG: hypothetical protein OEY59_11005 [Deltaproteobacteria bacterium]|nr:hypothetical protein [Deltaproteobacteria bacterium]